MIAGAGHWGFILLYSLAIAPYAFSWSRQAGRYLALARADAMGALLSAIGRVEALSGASADGAAEAAGAVTEQHVALQRLATTSQQLADVSERLRASIARFSVLGRQRDTAEYPVVQRLEVTDMTEAGR